MWLAGGSEKMFISMKLCHYGLTLQNVWIIFNRVKDHEEHIQKYFTILDLGRFKTQSVSPIRHDTTE